MEIHATHGGGSGLLNLHSVSFELVEVPLRAGHVTNSTKVDIILVVNWLYLFFNHDIITI